VVNYESFRKNSQKEYLGYCEQKGYIYSVQTGVNQYSVIALQNGRITVLITFTVQSTFVRN
jgi:predicted transcriptional regulator of viral defense system